jgi:4-amino-4-deoxy-L-arabinose transferase-like glycosyltransferase
MEPAGGESRPSPQAPPPAPGTAARPARGLATLLVVAAALWLVGASRRSLWQDEFHSLHHVQRPDLPALLESVRSDNHPPLSFLLERGSAAAFGVDALPLRLPAVLVGLLFLARLRRLCRRLPDGLEGRAASLAPWLVLASSYVFVIFTEARMYALLALATLGLLEALVHAADPRDGERPSRWWVALWVFVGLHAHYYFLHQLALAGLLAGLWALREPGSRRALAGLLPPLVLGLLLFLPWGLYGFRHQLTHELPPGGSPRGLMTLVQSIGHLFFWNASLGGPWLTRLVAWPGSVLAAVALLLGMRQLVARRAQAPGLAWFVLGFGLGLPLWGWCASLVLERSTYGWRYVAGAAAPVLLVAAVGFARRGLGVPRTLLLLCMATVTAFNLVAGGQEDHRRLVAHVLEHARPGDVVLAKPPWEPDPLPEETSWRYYLDRTRPGPKGHVPPQVLFTEWKDAREYERVWVWFRDPYSAWVEEALAKTFPFSLERPMGPGLTLHLFARREDLGGYSPQEGLHR